MAFPVVAASSKGNNASTTSHVLNIPSGVVAGDLLVAFLAQNILSGNTWPARWKQALAINSQPGWEIRWLIADGTEGASITVTTASAGPSSYIVLRITGHHGVTRLEITTEATGTSAAPDSSSISPSWGAEDNLIISAFTNSDGAISVSAYPTSYADNQIDQRANGQLGVTLATRNVNAASENPGAFTLSSASSSWRAVTIAIRPAQGSSGLKLLNQGAVNHFGNNNSKTAGTTLAVDPTAQIAAGIVAVVICVSDDDTSSGPTHAISDAQSNTWTQRKFRSGNTSDGRTTVSIFTSKLTTALPASSSGRITLTLGASQTAKAMLVFAVALGSGKDIQVADSNSTGSNQAGQSTTAYSYSVPASGNLSAGERLWVAMVGPEGSTGDSFTLDTEYADIAGSNVGTTGGGGASNVYLRAGVKISTVTSDTFNGSLAAADWESVFVALEEFSTGVTVTPTPVSLVTTSVNPTIVLGSLNVTPSPAFKLDASFAPTVVLGSLLVAPTASAFVATTPLPGIGFSPVAAASLVTEKVDPLVVLGSLSIQPTAGSAVMTSLAPTVVLGSLIVAPSAGFLIAERANPTAVLGSLLLAPSAVSIVQESFGPSVVLGSLQLTPSASAVIFASFPPTTILGSLVLQPVPGFLVASGLDPLAILGSLLIAPVPGALRLSTFLQTALEIEPLGPASLVLQALIHQVLGGEKRFDIPLTAGGITLLEKRERPL